MNIRYDEKGKFFTDIVSKDAVQVIIQTQTHRVEGKLYIRPGERLKDEINNCEQFIAITDATIYSVVANGAANELLYRCNFLTVNRDHIVWLIPGEELKEGQELAGGDS